MVATVEQLAALVRGRLVGDGSVSIRSARPVAEAGPGDITFIESERYAKLLRSSPASAAIVGPHFNHNRPSIKDDLAVIEVDDPISAFVAVRNHLSGEQKPRWTGIHPQACVAATARIGTNVAVYPFVYVGENAEIGDGTTLFPGVVIGEGCRIGKECTIHPNAVLYPEVVLNDRVEIHAGTVLGGDGFGYRQVSGRHVKIPHTGGLEVGSDVEIGANCAIDRATFEATRIGEGTKIDNLVMIGHNNQIGRHNLLCGQVGIAGSCTTGDNVVMAGQAGIKDKTQIGDGVIVGAQAGVHRNIPSGQQVLGSPAIPVREQRRIFQMIARLPEMHRQFRQLAAQLDVITAALSMQAETDRASARVADREADREIDPQADPTGF
ncbi:MAG: UDP-3-O-(3-hydroxymyristoyl)glucosamine N-acyltransferase [Planctomycetaceae bacterium]|nr:UDP-3-O-(3-hydroxymyristoyl)glucosamine N-acyltransferase [Planctomycetaceae bacterium]